MSPLAQRPPIPDVPEPLLSALKFECNANYYRLDDFIKTKRDGINPEYFEKLRIQLYDAEILRTISDPLVFEKLTAIGFESRESVMAWLVRLRQHLYENGPYPTLEGLN